MLILRGIVVKITTLLLVLSFVVTGCSINLPNRYGLNKENPTVITIWHYYNGVQKIEFDKMVEEFNKTTGKEEGIIVEAFNQGSINEVTEKIIDTVNKKIGTGKLPDAFTAYSDTAYEINRLGVISDFNQYLSKNDIDQYIDGYIDEGKSNDEDKLIIFPIAKSTEIIMVNKTDWQRFTDETNADITEFETWEGIADLAKKYYDWTDSKTELRNDGKAFFGRDAMANYMLVGSKELGEEIFQEKDGNLNINLNEEVIRRLWDNFYIPYINGYYAAYGKFRSDDAKTGDIIAFVGATSGAEYFPNTVIANDEKSYEIEPMILPLPTFKGKNGYMPQQGAGMVLVKSDSKHEYAVAEFLKWFTESNRNTAFSIKSGYLPVKKETNSVDFIKKVIKENRYLNMSVKSQEAIITALSQESNHKFYYNKVSYSINKARNILDKAMLEKAKLDREEIKKQLDTGISKEKILKKYESDENFKIWFQKLRDDIKGVV